MLLESSRSAVDELKKLPEDQQKAVIREVNAGLLPKSDTAKIIIWILTFALLGAIAIISLLSLISGATPDGMETAFFGLLTAIVGGVIGWMSQGKAPS